MVFYMENDMERFELDYALITPSARQLVTLVEKWLRREQAIVAELRRKQKEEDRVSGKKEFKREFQYALNNGWGSGRLNSTLKLSSNAVWRC